MRILGIDPSLAGTGACVIDHDGTARVTTIGSRPVGSDVLDRYARVRRIARDVTEWAGPVDAVVIEAPAYGSRQGQQHDRSGLWWLIVERVATWTDTVIEVAPTTRAKYATGRGNAVKDEVLIAVVQRYQNVGISTNDEADAVVLAHIGARLLDEPRDDVPKSHLAALAKLEAAL